MNDAFHNISKKALSFLVDGALYYSKYNEARGFTDQVVYPIEIPGQCCCVFIFAKRKDEYGVFIYSTEQKYIPDSESIMGREEAVKVHKDFLASLKTTTPAPNVWKWELKKGA